MGRPIIETYRRIYIRQDDDGFYAVVWGEHTDCHDTVEQVRACIDDIMAGPDDDRARQAIGWPNASEAP
jgi:hypothetical protein